jgi:predicted dehydrogenase
MSTLRSLGVVGAGWRAGFFVRAALALPERFAVSGVVTRSAERAKRATEAWRVPVYGTVADLLSNSRPDFIVVSVPPSAAVEVITSLVGAGLDVLAETPPAPDLDGLRRLTALTADGARIQVAEQYPYQPLHAARIHLTDSGALGVVHEAALSVAHGYHAFSLMRRHLGITGEAATIQASTLRFGVQSGSSRSGPRRRVTTSESSRTLGIVDFGDRVGTYDFADAQYWSYVHRHHVLIRGSDGELADERMYSLVGLDETVSRGAHTRVHRRGRRHGRPLSARARCR